MALSEADQVIWPALNVTTGGTPGAYVYGDVLPAATTTADLAVREILRAGGATRRAVVATTAEDLASAFATAASEATSREAEQTGAAVVDTPYLPVVGGLAVVEDIT